MKTIALKERRLGDTAFLALCVMGVRETFGQPLLNYVDLVGICKKKIEQPLSSLVLVSPEPHLCFQGGLQ